MNVRILLGSLALTAAAFTTPAFADDCTTISVVPAVISVPGNYCLSRSLRYEGMRIGNFVIDGAITIASDDVTLDLNGYTLSGGINASLNERSVGILVSSQRNVTVRNGAIRNFGRGLSTVSSVPDISVTGQVVESLLMDGMLGGCVFVSNHQAMIRDNRLSNCQGTAILVQGTAARVSNNSVSKVSFPGGSAFGIFVSGPGSIVQNNAITQVFSGQVGCGIGVNASALVKDNVLYNPQIAGSTGICIWTPSVAGVMVDNNAVTGFTTGIDLGAGNTANRFRNNTVNGDRITTYVGGTNLGGNN